MRILTTFAVAAAALWLYSPQAFADSTNGNGGGQGNGQGCGAGNTSAQNGGTCPGGSGGAGAQGGAGCVGGSDTVGCVIIISVLVDQSQRRFLGGRQVE